MMLAKKLNRYDRVKIKGTNVIYIFECYVNMYGVDCKCYDPSTHTYFYTDSKMLDKMERLTIDEINFTLCGWLQR